MKKETGSRDAAIWLLGDSNPRNFHSVLEGPFDPRHPARHNIWTPIVDGLQDRLFRRIQQRVDMDHVYIRNAVESPDLKPDGKLHAWGAVVEKEIEVFGHDLTERAPTFLFTFGAFSHEFCRRALGRAALPYSAWGAKKLGEQFRTAITTFKPEGVNVFPLLHATIARGKFIESHNYYCSRSGANYFDEVAEALACLLVNYQIKLPVCIDANR